MIRELKREVDEQLVKVAEDLLAAVKAGNVTGLVAFVEDGRMGKSAGVFFGGPVDFGKVLGAFELWKLQKAHSILEESDE